VNRIATGIALMMTPAERWPHWISYWPTMKNRPAESVRISVRDVKVITKSSSLHNATNAKMAVAATPGAASGRMIRQRAPKLVQPSTIALSSISRGIDSKYPTSIQTVNGTVKEK
jgi:hypothetical protein